MVSRERGIQIEIKLAKANESDAEAIHEIQLKAFLPLMVKYEDFDTNPANESIERVRNRINNPQGGFFKILLDNILVGAVCVYWKEENCYWISPMFVIPEHQGKGIAQKAISLLSKMFPQAASWELATIEEEKRNCYLYEKMGFIKTGVQKKINDKATLMYYMKLC